MNDQAQGLRNLVRPRNDPRSPATRIITVTSGKGGVGKSNFTLNFALALQAQGFKVLVFDADIGLANIDVLMGVRPEYSLYHLLKRERTLHDIICKGHEGLRFIAGGSGFQDLLRLSEEDLDYFAEEVGQLNGEVDFIVFDTGAGLSKETMKFILAAQETIVVTTPEPTAITDAYAIIKMVTKMNAGVHFQLVVNRVEGKGEGIQTADKIRLAARQFLNLDIPVLGFVPDDGHVPRSVKKQVPFTIAFPNSPAAKGIREVARTFLQGHRLRMQSDPGVKGFLRRMINLLK